LKWNRKSYTILEKESFMDTKKWKSVLVPRDIYEEIVTIARVEGRTISGLFRVVFDTWKTQNLTNKDLVYLQKERKTYQKKIEEREDELRRKRIQNVLAGEIREI
tara:strand:- start:6575 stop:6889 length:315 start_codon:yes stop_codon:yes gene_type:complete